MVAKAVSWMLALWVAAGSGSPPGYPQCPDGGTIVTELGQRAQLPEPFAPVGGGVVPYPSSPQNDARYVRVRFTVANPPDCEWFFTVRDPEHRLIQVFGREDFKNVTTRWTHRVNGAQALFDLSACDGNRAPEIKFVEYIWMPAAAANPYYSLQTAIPAYKDITTVDSSLRRLGDVAGFLVSSFGRASWVCSGVMLTPSLMLTNWHCGGPSTLPDNGIWNADIQRDTLIDLSFDGDTLSRELQITRLATTPNKALDFVVLRTAAVDALGPLRPVKLAAADPAANDDIRVVHHPAGKIKQLSSNCVVRDANYKGWQNPAVQSEFTHVCDTEGGSSGAPVLNARGELVGLHHLGFDFDRTRCVQTDRVNKAVKISAILEAIKLDNKEVYDEIVRWQKR
jgi:hypothetical protein